MRTLLLVLLLAASGLAETGPGLVLRPFPEGTGAQIRTEVEAYLDGTTDSGERFGLRRYELDARFLVGPVHLGLDLRYHELDSDDPRLPARLVDQSVAAAMRVLEREDWTLDLLLGLGTASDEPYVDSDAWYARADLIATYRVSERASWVFSLDYDGNRVVLPDWPLPAVVYQRFVGPSLRFAVGFPFLSATWRPHQEWTIDFRALVVALEVRLRVGYRPRDDLELYAEFTGDTRAYNVRDRPVEERLFFRQRRVEAGVQWTPDQAVSLGLATGYGFDRQYRAGEDVRDLEDYVDVSNELYFRLVVEVRF